MATIEDFNKIDVRVGRIIEVEDFSEAKKHTYKLKVDFVKEIGIKRSCAQLVKNCLKEDLMGKLVLGVVNFSPRQIGPAVSEVLRKTSGIRRKIILKCPKEQVQQIQF